MLRCVGGHSMYLIYKTFTVVLNVRLWFVLVEEKAGQIFF